MRSAHLRVLWLLNGLDWLILPICSSASCRRENKLSSWIASCFFCSLKSFSSSRRRCILASSCSDWRATRFLSTNRCARKKILPALRGTASLVLQEADSSSCSISILPQKDLSVIVGPSGTEDWWTVLSRYSYDRQQQSPIMQSIQIPDIACCPEWYPENSSLLGFWWMDWLQDGRENNSVKDKGQYYIYRWHWSD